MSESMQFECTPFVETPDVKHGKMKSMESCFDTMAALRQSLQKGQHTPGLETLRSAPCPVQSCASLQLARSSIRRNSVYDVPQNTHQCQPKTQLEPLEVPFTSITARIQNKVFTHFNWQRSNDHLTVIVNIWNRCVILNDQTAQG